MALSLILGEAGFTATHMETTAEVSLEKQSDGFAITAVTPDAAGRGDHPRRGRRNLPAARRQGQGGLPVSKLLKADISLDAALVA